VKALVVDDSQFMRTVVRQALTEADYEVVEASDGEQAVQATRRHDPDVITMDVEMPTMNGIDATEAIMSTQPTPILMLSAHTERGAEATFDALSKGAVDFLPKPDGEVSTDTADLAVDLVEKVETVRNADVSAVTPGTDSTGDGAGDPADPDATADATADDVESSVGAVPTEYVENPTVVLGASTGGPKVLQRVLYDLPRDVDARVLLVQHMPENFTARLAERLDSVSAYDVSEADDGMRVGAGEAVLARGGRHMRVDSYGGGRLRLTLTDEEKVHGVRPAIDVTMHSAATTIDDPLVGVALTGMGADGARGIEAIKQAGGKTIAQDEASSPVWGIPGSAVETGAVDAVVGAAAVADAVVRALEA
jgi:two-component system chemotaxis response regulator CheB